MSEVSKVQGDPIAVLNQYKKMRDSEESSPHAFEKKVIQERPTESQIDRAIGSVVDEYV